MAFGHNGKNCDFLVDLLGWASLPNVAIIDRNRRQLQHKMGLSPLEMGVFPFHAFDIVRGS